MCHFQPEPVSPLCQSLPFFSDLESSLRVAPKREGDSHFSEAWRLPSLDARKTDTVDGGDWNGGNGGYVGLFRPPGGAKDEMGFHMCVAVIPSGAAGGGTGVVVEEMVERPSLLDRGHPNPIHDKKVS